MTRSAALRRLLASALPAVAVLMAPAGGGAVAEPLVGWALNSYGLPGAVDTPSAEVFPDAELSVQVSQSTYGRRITGAFQIIPQVTAALRYSRLDGIDRDRDFLMDRSADLRFQLWGEAGWRPAVAVGLQDFLGTGVYSGEYVVATKRVTDRLTASAGVGWGRLAGEHRVFDPNDEGGKPNLDTLFRGTAKPFASLAWEATPNLRLVAEYSNDDYGLEVENDKEAPSGHVNVGLNYRWRENYQVSAYTIGGKVFGASLSFAMNPRRPPYASGLEPAPAPVRLRAGPAEDPEGWSGAWAADPTAQPAIQQALGDALQKEGQVLEAMALGPDRAEIRIENRRYIAEAEAVGRAARLMTRALPPSVETLVVTTTRRGMPVSSVVMRRADVERLENTDAGQIAAAAQVVDAAPRVDGMVRTPGLYPRFTWGVKPYFDTGLFDPDQGFRYALGAEANARYEPLPGLVISGAVRQRAFGNADQKAPGRCPDAVGTGTHGCTVDEYLDLTQDERTALNNGVPRVRSDGRMYSGIETPVISNLTLAWYAKPAPEFYSRVTVGLLERMYGGVSAELLWMPATSNLALGAEINRVKKRDYEGLFGFQDYEVTTGHVSAYYDFGNGFVGQLDAGRYLAGDTGATVRLTREFANGWKVGAYVTKTDLSDEQFGEGSFDKGITLDIPLSWATGQPSRQTVGGTLGALSRDGGQRVKVEGRLYDTVRDSSANGLYQGWGRFWR